MKQFILRRLLLAVVTLIGVSWLIFAIMWMIPGDVAISILGDGANPERDGNSARNSCTTCRASTRRCESAAAAVFPTQRGRSVGFPNRAVNKAIL